MKLKQISSPSSSLFLVFSILVALTYVSLASNDLNRDPVRDRRQCEQRCQRQQPYYEEHHCMRQCQQAEEQERGWNNREKRVLGDAEHEYERCQQSCPGTGKEQWQCQRRCQDDYEAALERERGREPEHEGEGGRGHDHGGGGRRHPEEHRYKHCIRDCEDREEGFPRQRQCKLQCEKDYGHGGRHSSHDRERGHQRNDVNKHHKTGGKEQKENPYYFNSQSFESRYSTHEGHMRVLQRFSENSELLQGIDKFRVAFYEANPNSFMLPHHWDADSVLFVIGGRATMTFLRKENRESFNLERGDVLMIPAGTTAYLVNSHNDENLQIAELLRPVNTPGEFQQYFGVGGNEPESFFNSFSKEILEAALDVPRDQLDRLFKQQKEGVIVKARRDQVKTLAQHGMGARRMGESRGPVNLLDEEPMFANDNGEFYQVSPREYELLEDLDVSVAYCDIKQGSMMAPHYNSRTTHIVMVTEGSGYFEMACPHLGSTSRKNKETKKQEGSSLSYKKVRSSLSKGDVFVIPAGHPIAIVSSENESLKTVGFGINARHNQRNFLAGQENIINQLDREAKELSFSLPAMEVEEIFQKQRKSYFMSAPQKQQNPVVSLLNFAGL